MTDGSDKHSGKPINPGRRSLTKFEIGGIVVLSALVHFGLWWLYKHSPIQHPKPMKLQQGPPPIQVTLTKPQPVEKVPVIDTHAVMPPKKKKPKPKPKPKPRPKPQPKPEPKPKPQPKPEPKPEPKSQPKPDPKPEPKPAPKPSPSSNKITPAVSGLQSLGNPPPHYPSRALRRHEEGNVKLKILVEPNGTAGSVTVIKSSGYSDLDNAAVETVKKWRFKPAKRGNTPIRGYALQTISFNIPD
ncbi:MAG: TonB family protein [Salinisphaera sp.]|uniref:energy transducer TonB n=1 Tax=Salinisphaera sp. TaxID=1914330 RepID=UPI003C7B28BC